MKKTVAVLTQKNTLSKGVQKNTVVRLFHLEDGNVKGVETVKPEKTDNNFMSLLLESKEVETIYLDSINNELRNHLTEANINIKCRNEIHNDEFINQFIFD